MVYTLLMFTGGCASAVDESNADAVLMTDESNEENAVRCYDIYGGKADPIHVRQLFDPLPGLHAFAGMATKVNWSPTAFGESSPAWCVVTVSRTAIEPARLLVRRIDEDEKWTQIPMTDAPWFAASTAAALRGMLKGEFAPVRKVVDPRLLEPVREANPPDTYPDGRL